MQFLDKKALVVSRKPVMSRVRGNERGPADDFSVLGLLKGSLFNHRQAMGRKRVA